MSSVARLHKPNPEWRCRIGRVVPHKAGNVEHLNIVTPLDVEPSRILACAMEHGMSVAVVVGYDQAGDFYFSSSAVDGGTVLWLMAIAERRLLSDATAASSNGPTAA